jgi:cytochrome d ubiquinol oxidase subunit II
LPPVDEPTLLGAAMLGALVFYALFGGADFGGGVWHLLAAGPRAGRQRALVAHAIGPIWEANHVWLILVVVVLFTGFPAAFAEISTRLHPPLIALLVAIVVRGAAFAFHSARDPERVPLPRQAPASEARLRLLDSQTGPWGLAFALSSLVAPILLGATVAVLASGRAAEAPTTLLAWRGPWLAPFPLASGLFALALFAFLAAVYLTVDAGDDRALQEDFRRRALAAGVLSGALALATFLLARDGAPLVREGLSRRSWSWPLHIVTAAAALTALYALLFRKWRLARAAAAAQVAFVVLGWGASQFPYLVVPTLTLRSASAPRATQGLLLGALGAGLVVLLPSLWLLFRVFKSRETPGSDHPPADARRPRAS